MQRKKTAFSTGQLVSYPPYSPELALSDFFPIPKTEKYAGWQIFASNDEVIAATDSYFADLETSYLSDGLKTLKHSLKKVY